MEALKRRASDVEEVHRRQLANRRPSDTDIDRFIVRAGAGRVPMGSIAPRGRATARRPPTVTTLLRPMTMLERSHWLNFRNSRSRTDWAPLANGRRHHPSKAEE